MNLFRNIQEKLFTLNAQALYTRIFVENTVQVFKISIKVRGKRGGRLPFKKADKKVQNFVKQEIMGLIRFTTHGNSRYCRKRRDSADTAQEGSNKNIFQRQDADIQLKLKPPDSVLHLQKATTVSIASRKRDQI